jgi:hypothetical protein
VIDKIFLMRSLFPVNSVFFFIKRNRHMSIRGRNGPQTTQPDEVPPPLFRTRVRSGGQRSLASISGVEPAFYV